MARASGLRPGSADLRQAAPRCHPLLRIPGLHRVPRRPEASPVTASRLAQKWESHIAYLRADSARTSDYADLLATVDPRWHGVVETSIYGGGIAGDIASRAVARPRRRLAGQAIEVRLFDGAGPSAALPRCDRRGASARDGAGRAGGAGQNAGHHVHRPRSGRVRGGQWLPGTRWSAACASTRPRARARRACLNRCRPGCAQNAPGILNGLLEEIVNRMPAPELSALDAYRALLRDHVAPALRRDGYTGSGGRFRRIVGEHEVFIQFQKARFSTRARVDYQVHIDVIHRATAELFRQANEEAMALGRRPEGPSGLTYEATLPDRRVSRGGWYGLRPDDDLARHASRAARRHPLGCCSFTTIPLNARWPYPSGQSARLWWRSNWRCDAKPRVRSR